MYIKKLLKRIYEKFLFRRNVKYLGRTACLGNFVLDRYCNNDKKVVYYNQQKVRVDLFMQYVSGALRPETKKIEKFLNRKDIIGLIAQQENLPWIGIKKCRALIMDSFAELTDQKFVYKEDGYAFCCHYSDIEHN